MDRTGIVAALSDFVFRHNGNILDADQHADEDSKRFYMRLVWSADGLALNRAGFVEELRLLAEKFQDSQWELFFKQPKPRVAVLCGRTPHCLYDLLLRQKMNELEGEIVAVISEYEALREVTEHFGLAFHFIPFAPGEIAKTEEKQLRLLRDYRIDLAVLARYMRVLSPDFVAEWKNRMINIHHSFLPAFAGARPYQQAKTRGVKIIGATAHYVTADLDQGPIIEQDVIRISHRDTVDDMIRKGRDLERQVLAGAVRLHLEHRILVEANRTIIFA
jgi:formyltetrahydrofolate deformylase